MRKIVFLGLCAAALLPLLSAKPAQAQEYPWCARYDWTTSNCGFVSFQQCLATIQGIGGRCQQNPRYVPRPPRRKPRR